MAWVLTISLSEGTLFRRNSVTEKSNDVGLALLPTAEVLDEGSLMATESEALIEDEDGEEKGDGGVEEDVGDEIGEEEFLPSRPFCFPKPRNSDMGRGRDRCVGTASQGTPCV